MKKLHLVIPKLLFYIPCCLVYVWSNMTTTHHLEISCQSAVIWSIKQSVSILHPAVRHIHLPPPSSQAAGVWTWCRCPRWWPARGTWPWPRSSAALWPPCCWPCWSCVWSTARDSCWRRSPAVSHNICTYLWRRFLRIRTGVFYRFQNERELKRLALNNLIISGALKKMYAEAWG